MNPVFILLCMVFCHIVDDYYLQGVLANMKQKEWWKKNAPAPLYKYDYIPALICHAFSWTFIVQFPILIYLGECTLWYIIFFIGNLIIHALTDDLKANLKMISLVIDQLIHWCQILITWNMLCLLS